jgi:hypothetical protein
MKTNHGFLELIAVLGLLGGGGFFAAGCNAECAGTVEVNARPDQCYTVLIAENGQAVMNGKYCGAQSASVPAGTYSYSAATHELVGRRLASGEVTVACAQTVTVDLDDSRGAPAGAEVLVRDCRGLPPAAAVIANADCRSGQAKLITNDDVYCTNGKVDYNQWGLVCL